MTCGYLELAKVCITTVEMLTAPPSAPSSYDRVVIIEDPSPRDNWFARAEIHNLFGVYDEDEVDMTSHGQVVIHYETNGGHEPGNASTADEACVVSLPDGVTAHPLCVSILDGEIGNIYLYEYLGG